MSLGASSRPVPRGVALRPGTSWYRPGSFPTEAELRSPGLGSRGSTPPTRCARFRDAAIEPSAPASIAKAHAASTAISVQDARRSSGDLKGRAPGLAQLAHPESSGADDSLNPQDWSIKTAQFGP